MVVVGDEPAPPVMKQLHALENFFDLYSHADAKGLGKAVVAVTVLWVYVAQKPAITAEELTKAAAQASVSGFEQARTAGTAATAVRKTDFILEIETTTVKISQGISKLAGLEGTGSLERSKSDGIVTAALATYTSLALIFIARGPEELRLVYTASPLH